MLLIILIYVQCEAARLYTSGFESNHLGANSTELWTAATGTAAIQTTTVRSGTYALQSNPADGVAGFVDISFTMASGSTAYCIGYARIDDLPTGVNTELFVIYSGSNYFFVGVHPSGKLGFGTGGGYDDSSTATITTGQWFLIEMKCKFSTSAASHEVKVLGETHTDATNDAATEDASLLELGVGSASAHGGVNYYFDDVLINDASGASETGYHGAFKLAYLWPISDGGIGNWTDGGGGTTSLFESMNNTPPTGASTDANGKSIKTVNASTTDTARFNLTTYTNGGVGANDTVKVLIPIWRSGEHSATGTKAGRVGIESNPAIATVSFNFGNNAGAHGNEIGNWRTAYGTTTYNPSVTLGTSPVLLVIDNSSTTTGDEVDFAALIVDYAVYVAPPVTAQARRRIIN